MSEWVCEWVCEWVNFTNLELLAQLRNSLKKLQHYHKSYCHTRTWLTTSTSVEDLTSFSCQSGPQSGIILGFTPPTHLQRMFENLLKSTILPLHCPNNALPWHCPALPWQWFYPKCRVVEEKGRVECGPPQSSLFSTIYCPGMTRSWEINSELIQRGWYIQPMEFSLTSVTMCILFPVTPLAGDSQIPLYWLYPAYQHIVNLWYSARSDCCSALVLGVIVVVS